MTSEMVGLCRACEQEIDYAKHELCPNCGDLLRSPPPRPKPRVQPVSRVNEGPPPHRPANESTSAAHAPLAAPDKVEGRCRREGCGATLPAGATTCPYCGLAVGEAQSLAPVSVEVGGEVVELPVDRPLNIGREEGPFARVLSGREEVSREHAQVERRDDGSVWITDLRSSNGTFVEGRELEPDCPEQVEVDTSIRLTTDSPVFVRILSERPVGRAR